MARLPRPSGLELVRFLEQRGLHVVRIRGSRYFLEGGRWRTCVPVHGSRALKIGTLRSILRDIDLSPADFESVWRR